MRFTSQADQILLQTTSITVRVIGTKQDKTNKNKNKIKRKEKDTPVEVYQNKIRSKIHDKSTMKYPYDSSENYKNFGLNNERGSTTLIKFWYRIV
jgi:hypothetical protein